MAGTSGDNLTSLCTMICLAYCTMGNQDVGPFWSYLFISRFIDKQAKLLVRVNE